MNLRIAAMVLFGSAALVACDSAQKPAESDKTQPAPLADDAAAAKLDADALAKAPEAKEEGEEGCVYGENHGEKHGEKSGEEHGAHEGCGHGGEAAPSGEPGHHGQAFALAENKPLKDVLASAEGELPTTPIQVRGEVDSVCQKKGCWMVLKDGDTAIARILMKDHSFTVPMDAKGKSAIVEGTLASRTFSEKEVKHLEKDGGGDPAQVAGERKEFVLTASGIKIPPNS